MSAEVLDRDGDRWIETQPDHWHAVNTARECRAGECRRCQFTRVELEETFGPVRATRTCQREGCKKPLPPGSAPQRRYCTERCQVAEWRRRAVEKP